MRLGVIAFALALLAAQPARAAVADAQGGGFQVSGVLEIAAPPATAWKALTQVGRWWSGQHTYSGVAKNLSLQAKAGGCFCEIWPGGQVEHMRVVYAEPGKLMRLEGGLGPLQDTGASGHLSWALAEIAGRTRLTWRYDVGGYVKGGAQAWAGPVDSVLSEQMGRLKAYIEAAAR